jgi:predicted lysophospholipase L1 biosynthesis ABC-type transport system permease subunit
MVFLQVHSSAIAQFIVPHIPPGPRISYQCVFKEPDDNTRQFYSRLLKKMTAERKYSHQTNLPQALSGINKYNHFLYH